jgi:hypothetical protein
VAAAHQKLSTYYSKTYGPGGEIYNWATILDPSQKLDLYKAPNFSANNLKTYDESFRREVLKNYTVLSQTEALADTNLVDPDEIDLADFARTQQCTQARPSISHAPCDDYLDSKPTDDKDPLRFWVRHEIEYPGLSHMAKDVLAVPVSGVGVERIFSAARQICSYQRNRLGAETIKRLMLVRFAYEMSAGAGSQLNVVDSKEEEEVREQKREEARADFSLAALQDIGDDEIDEEEDGGGGADDRPGADAAVQGERNISHRQRASGRQRKQHKRT